ncbi:MAG: response regulator [Candidatus Omnitrophica bacterium]|nr:response regulator [Candidatus Omnitrophota bacterium]MBU2044244.1 response regulator [Candidatus Omnitrophota bacterium]MBU2251116.1 response regulator [Candidatus Omnitrophota bacterium]MBU2473439.1 response regulator [Candidatus Omnitrophota bacterium]
MAELKILIVDDDLDILDLLEATLSGEFDVVRAATGNQALEKVKTESPNLLVLDYMLPDLKGPDICRAIRGDTLASNTPILMLTGKGETEDKVEGLEAGADDYMLKPFVPQELVARIRMLIRRSRANLDANPLTRLPGNASITKELREKIEAKEKIAVLSIDIDNFKALNDYYGFEQGDSAIKTTARILINSIQKKGNLDDFIGHIGGDDFLIVTTPEAAEEIAKKIIADFDAQAPLFFQEKDRIKGYIETKGRDNEIHKFGFPSISIGIITNTEREFTHTAQISSLSAETKNLAKKFNGSKYIFDRRKE